MDRKEENIYIFKKWGKNFVVDINSLNFFEIDNLTKDIIKLLDDKDEKEIINILSVKYQRKEIKKVIEQLKKLRKNRLLFNKDIKKSIPALKKGNFKITSLLLNVINDCNLRCKYCWSIGGTYDGTHKGKKMQKEIAIKSVDLLIKESGNIKDLRIDFYGGEPLLNFDIIRETIEYCKLQENKFNKKFYFGINTNGTLLTKKIAEYLFKNKMNIAISIDGPSDIHDKVRIFPNGRGSYNIIMENFNNLPIQIKNNITARVTFTPLNLDTGRIIKFLYDCGFKNIQIFESDEACFNMNKTKKKFFFISQKDMQILKNIYLNLFRFYLKELESKNIIYSKRFVKDLSDIYLAKRKYRGCGAGAETIAVSVNGDIYPCLGFLEIGYKMGNVNREINRDIQEELANVRIIEKNTDCQNCWAKFFCRGSVSCPAINYFHNKNILTIYKKRCEIYKYKTELLIASLSELKSKNPQFLRKILKREKTN